MRTAFPFRALWIYVSLIGSNRNVSKTYRKSCWLSNFLGFLGQQSQMKRPLIFDEIGFGKLTTVVGTESFPVASIAGGSKDAGPGSPLASTGCVTVLGGLGLRMDFS